MSKFEKLWKYIGAVEGNFLSLTYQQIEEIAGLPLDHSFLKYKKELEAYGWAVKKIYMKEQRVEFSEAWDAYDGEMKKINGVTLLRCDKVPEGMYHLVVSVIVRHEDGTYLLMQRSSEKSGAGLWELSGCGSVKIGETAEFGAKREILEETGVQCQELKEIRKGISGNFIFVYFLGIADCTKDSVVLQKNETSAYKWVPREELEKIPAEEFLSENERNLVFELGL